MTIEEHLKKFNPKAKRIVKNDFCDGWDVVYGDEFHEKTWTFKMGKENPYLLGSSIVYFHQEA